MGKSGPKKGSEIIKHLRMNKGQVYRLLNSLVKKGIVESTLEHPKRFLAVPLEKVINSFIRSKREEVDQIEQTKEDLLSDWKKIKQIQLESSVERFSVIEGEKKIFNKISQMIKETKKEFLTISSVYGMLRADNFGIFEEIKNHPLKEKVKFHFLTQITKDDLKAIKTILENLSSAINVKGRDPNRTSSVFPRVVIKDKNEILLFISNDEKVKSALYTDCKSIIESFYGVFHDLWSSSADIRKRVVELETGKPTSIMELIRDPITAKKKYFEVLDKAKEEILLVIPSKRLIDIYQDRNFLRNKSKIGISIKIMTPITYENLKSAQNLLNFSEVRHIPVGFREITIIDDLYFFQFNSSSGYEGSDNEINNFKNLFFTTNVEYIRETKENLGDVWIKTRTPPSTTLDAIIRPSLTGNSNPIVQEEHRTLDRVSIFKYREIKSTTEETVNRNYRTLKRYPIARNSKNKIPEIARFFGTGGFAFIHHIPQLKIPEFIVGVFKANFDSSFGEDNHLLIFIKNEKSSDPIFEPAAIIQTNPDIIDYRQKAYENTNVESNIRLVGKDKLQILAKGNTLFVGWTIPIPLVPGNHVLPPSCILFEGYGEVKSGFFTNVFPSGRKQDSYYNCLEAFVTYFHPSMKYSVPGTEGFLDKEFLFTSYR